MALLTTGTGDTLAAFGGARERGGLVMSVSATSKELTDLTDDGLVWRTAPSDVSQGQVLAQQVDRALGPDGADRRVAIFEANTVYANGLRSVFKDHLVEAGDTREFLFDEGGADLDSRLGEANGYDPDVAVIIAGPTDAAAVVNDFPRRLQLKDARIFLTDAAKNGTFLEALSEDGHVRDLRQPLRADLQPRRFGPELPRAQLRRDLRPRPRRRLGVRPGRRPHRGDAGPGLGAVVGPRRPSHGGRGRELQRAAKGPARR